MMIFFCFLLAKLGQGILFWGSKEKEESWLGQGGLAGIICLLSLCADKVQGLAEVLTTNLKGWIGELAVLECLGSKSSEETTLM